MRLTIKARQVIGATAIVGIAMVVMGVMYVSAVARVRLEASQSAGQLLADTIYHRARAVASTSTDAYAALQRDPGLESILESSAYSPNVTYAAIVGPDNVVVAHSDVELVGRTLPVRPTLDGLLAQGSWAQLSAVYSGDAATLEIQQPLLEGNRRFGTVRIGISTLLTKADVDAAIRPAAFAAVLAVLGASLTAMVLSRSLLRPIHLIRAGLSRLGRGEFGVAVDATGHHELGNLGGGVNVLDAKLSAEHAAGDAGDDRAGDDAATLSRARQVVALSRLSAGIAHEIRNPLNAIAIHLELLSQQLSALPRDEPGTGRPPSSETAASDDHLAVIRGAVRRLDDVLQSYLKFIRPETLHLEPTSVPNLLNEVLPIVRAEAGRAGIDVVVDCPGNIPAVAGDRGLLQQAVLNLALNGCQAMPDGGRLRISGRAMPGRRVAIVIEDTGTGIAAADLPHVFDLYFTKRPGGSGMGLALVYRTIRLHDGDIEVDSSPGSGTTFRILLPQAGQAPGGS